MGRVVAKGTGGPGGDWVVVVEQHPSWVWGQLPGEQAVLLWDQGWDQGWEVLEQELVMGPALDQR